MVKPKNFSQAIDELEDQDHRQSSDRNGPGEDIRDRLEREFKRMQDTLESLKPHLDGLGERVGSEAHKAKERVEKEVADNPWAAIGIVGLIFFVVGFLFGFKGSRRHD